jgi:catechol 2,3-dioxygenase-like lactoylglutathione lyase family enzyme
MGTELSHIFMLVSDLERQRRLFVDILGLAVLAEHSGYLRIAGSEGFHIGMEQGNPGPPNAMEITIQVDDVDQMYERLVDAGVEVEGPPMDQDWGARHAWFRDGDGRRMSIYS